MILRWLFKPFIRRDLPSLEVMTKEINNWMNTEVKDFGEYCNKMAENKNPTLWDMVVMEVKITRFYLRYVRRRR